MDEVHFVNTRFDPDVIGFHAIAQEMMKSLRWLIEVAPNDMGRSRQ